MGLRQAGREARSINSVDQNSACPGKDGKSRTTGLQRAYNVSLYGLCPRGGLFWFRRCVAGLYVLVMLLVGASLSIAGVKVFQRRMLYEQSILYSRQTSLPRKAYPVLVRIRESFLYVSEFMNFHITRRLLLETQESFRQAKEICPVDEKPSALFVSCSHVRPGALRITCVLLCRSSE